MCFSEEIKKIRLKAFLSQTDFAEEICVSFSTVNRWENGKGRPNLKAMKKIKEFCLKHDISFIGLENVWIKHSNETNND